MTSSGAINPNQSLGYVGLWWRLFKSKVETFEMEKTDNNRFVLFSVSMTDMGLAALPLLFIPQFSHRSSIVLPF